MSTKDGKLQTDDHTAAGSAPRTRKSPLAADADQGDSDGTRRNQVHETVRLSIEASDVAIAHGDYERRGWDEAACLGALIEKKPDASDIQIMCLAYLFLRGSWTDRKLDNFPTFKPILSKFNVIPRITRDSKHTDLTLSRVATMFPVQLAKIAEMSRSKVSKLNLQINAESAMFLNSLLIDCLEDDEITRAYVIYVSQLTNSGLITKSLSMHFALRDVRTKVVEAAKVVLKDYIPKAKKELKNVLVENPVVQKISTRIDEITEKKLFELKI